jgi:hypothetical protein
LTKKVPKVLWPAPVIDEKMRARLDNGARQRTEIKRQIEAGEEPQGYRAEWLRESAHAILDLMATRAGQFNAVHEDDQASVADLLDAISTAERMLLDQSAGWKRAMSEQDE